MAVTIAETGGHVTETALKSPLSPPVTMRRNDRSHSPKYAAKTKLIGQAKLTGRRCCALPPATWCVWAASAAGGTRIMREPLDMCARNGRNGLQTGRNGLRIRFADASGWLASPKSAAAKRSMSTSSMIGWTPPFVCARNAHWSSLAWVSGLQQTKGVRDACYYRGRRLG